MTRKRTLSTSEVISEMTEILQNTEGEYIEDVANSVLGGKVTYLEDDLFQIEEG